MLGIRTTAHALWRDVSLLGYRTLASQRHFTFNNRLYPYFYARYNSAHLNERTIEIPVARAFVGNLRSVLEVGNVLNHYASFLHDVVDKWEPGAGVLNCDIRDYRTPKRYDRIVLISTLEHIGWDETPRQPENLIAGLESLRSLLSPIGRLLATIPVGYNLWLDEQLRRNRIAFRRIVAMHRISRGNDWEECSVTTALTHVYGKPYGWANAVLFAYL